MVEAYSEIDPRLMLTGMVSLPGRNKNVAYDTTVATDVTTNTVTHGDTPGYDLKVSAMDSAGRTVHAEANIATATLTNSADEGTLAGSSPMVTSFIREVESGALKALIPASQEEKGPRNDYSGMVPAYAAGLTDSALLGLDHSIEVLSVSGQVGKADGATTGSIVGNGNLKGDTDVFWLGTDAGSIGLQMSPDWTLEITLDDSDNTGSRTTGSSFEGTVMVMGHNPEMSQPKVEKLIDQDAERKYQVSGFACGQRYYVQVDASKAGNYLLDWKVVKNAGT